MSDAFDDARKLRQEIGELWPRLIQAEARLAEAEARHRRVMSVIRPFCAKYTPDLLAEFDAAAASSTDKICARAAHLSDVLVKDSASVRHEPDPPYGSEAWLFRELMAMMHGDEGHYHAQHGRQKAFDDAVKKYYALVTKADQPSVRCWIDAPSPGLCPKHGGFGLNEEHRAEVAAARATNPTPAARCKYCLRGLPVDSSGHHYDPIMKGSPRLTRCTADQQAAPHCPDCTDEDCANGCAYADDDEH